MRLPAAALALAAAFAAGPAMAARPHAPRVTLARPPVTSQTPAGPVTELVLANGLHVILKENHTSPVVTFDVTYRVGSRDEPLGQTGSAHLLEHMLFKGTRTFGKGQIARLLGRNGASYNASTWPDYTNFYETYASDRLELGFLVEASRMRDALILDSERQPEMTVVRNEMETDESDPANVLYQEVTELAYGQHPYHHPTIGYRSDVEGVTTAQLKHFYDTYYQPNNAVAVLVGDFKTVDAIALAHRYFDRLPAGPLPPRVHTTEEPQTGERRVVVRRRGATNALQVAFHIPQVASKDLAALRVLDALLTSGQSSRLQQALVEQDLANGVWSEVGLQHDSSLFRIGLDLKPAHDGQTDHAHLEEALWRALDRLRTSLAMPEELARARRQTLAADAFANEGAEDLAQELGAYAVRDRWQRAYELKREIAGVTAFDLQRVAATYLNRDNATTGWYVGTPDGPVPPAPDDADGGKATGGGKAVAPPPVFDFERQAGPLAHPPMPARQVLANGLEAWVLPNPGSATVSLAGFVRAGGVADPPGKAGVAEAVADMLDVGSGTHDKLAEARELEDVGATLNAEGGAFTTDLSGQCLPQDLDRLIDALAERLRDPRFPASELERVQDGWKANLAQADDDPATRARRLLARAIYPPGHPLYQRTPAEAGREIDAITRADLVAFHHAHYGPNTTVVVLVGNLQPAAAFARLERAFDGWAPATPTPATASDVPLDAPTKVAVDMPGKTEVEIFLGHAAPVRRADPGYFAYALANDILGGDTWSSRLGAKLRDEMGLTYGTYSEIDAGLVPGPWDATVSVNPANTVPALVALQGELARFATGGVTDQELAFSKRSFIGAQTVTLATNSGMARSIARMALFGLGADYWQRYPALVEAVTRAQVDEAARKLVHPEAAHVVIVGPGAKAALEAR